jgi:hypothetical protein
MVLREIIEDSIEEILKDYKREERSYLTEGDVICRLFLALSHKLKVFVHSQMRPYARSGKDVLVIINGEWEKGNKANKGSLVDLAIIDTDEKFWKDAFKKAKNDQGSKLRYWRILSYPVEAFLAAIEVKIRVRGNVSRIYKDIEKLVAIRKKNPKCLAYLVVLDRCATPEDLEKIGRRAANENISFFSLGLE